MREEAVYEDAFYDTLEELHWQQIREEAAYEDAYYDTLRRSTGRSNHEHTLRNSVQHVCHRFCQSLASWPGLAEFGWCTNTSAKWYARGLCCWNDAPSWSAQCSNICLSMAKSGIAHILQAVWTWFESEGRSNRGLDMRETWLSFVWEEKTPQNVYINERWEGTRPLWKIHGTPQSQPRRY